jgi:hypothetical protein
LSTKNTMSDPRAAKVTIFLFDEYEKMDYM